jgi:hypothetical protein
MRWIPFLLMFGLAFPAVAGDDNPFTNATGGGDASVRETGDAAPPRPDAKPDILLRMSRKDCERLLRRVDVPGADYVPGVDVRGNAVASADLEGTLTATDILPEEIAFELAFNPLASAGNAALATTFSEASSSVGTVKFNLSSGSLTLNGKPLTDGSERDMIALCRQALGEG